MRSHLPKTWWRKLGNGFLVCFSLIIYFQFNRRSYKQIPWLKPCDKALDHASINLIVVVYPLKINHSRLCNFIFCKNLLISRIFRDCGRFFFLKIFSPQSQSQLSSFKVRRSISIPVPGYSFKFFDAWPRVKSLKIKLSKN
jgi:hypothetical protein